MGWGGAEGRGRPGPDAAGTQPVRSQSPRRAARPARGTPGRRREEAVLPAAQPLRSQSRSLRRQLPSLRALRLGLFHFFLAGQSYGIPNSSQARGRSGSALALEPSATRCVSSPRRAGARVGGCRSVRLAACGLAPPLTIFLSPTHTLINTGHVEILSQSVLLRRVLNVVIYKQLSHSPKSSFLVSRDEFSGPLHFAV